MNSNRISWFLPVAAVWVMVTGPSVVSGQETGAATGADHMTARQLVAICVDHYQKHDLVSAKADCTRAISLSPKLGIAYYNLAAVYFALGGPENYQRALDNYNKADQFDPNQPETLFGRGVTHYKLHQNAEARADYQRAIDLGFETPTVFLDLGVLNFEEGKYPEADHDYSIAIKKRADFTNAYVNRATERWKSGNDAGAQADYDKAISLDATDASTYYDRGVLEFERHDVDRAIKDYNQAIVLDPNDPKFYYDLGVAYQQKEQWDLAAQNYREVVRRRADDSQAYYNLATVEYKSEHYQDAANDYTTALGLKPNWAIALHHRGLAYLKLAKETPSDVDSAIRDFNEAIKDEPAYADSASLYSDLGVAYLLKGDFADAISACNSAIERKLDTAEVYYNRGLAYEQTKEYDKAIDDFKVATGKKPEYGEAWRQLGETYDEKAVRKLEDKDWNAARALWAEALPCLEKAEHQLNHPGPDLYDALGRAHYGEREYKRAAADYENEIKERRTAEALINRGTALYRANELKPAIVDFKEAIQLKPDSALAYCDLHAAYLKDKQYPEADAALNGIPQDARVHCRGEAMSEADMTALRDFEHHDLPKAAVDCQEAINRKPTDPLAHYCLGAVRFESKPQTSEALTEAIKEFTAALEYDHDYADALNGRGLAYLAEKDWANAEQDLRKAYDLRAAHRNTLTEQDDAQLAKKKEAESLLGLADVHVGRNEFPEALEFYHRSLELNPDNPLAWEGTGLALYKTEKFKESIEAYDQAIPKLAAIESNAGRGDSYRQADQRNSAEAHLGRGDAYARRAEWFAKQHDVAKAQEDWRKALEDYQTADQMKPQDPGILLNLGLAYFKTGNVKEANTAYKEAIRLDRRSGLVYYDRAAADLIEKRLGSALADSTRAVGLSKRQDPDALDLQGITLAEPKRADVKQLVHARNDFSKALSLKQNDVDLLSNLASTEVGLRQYAKAFDHLSSALSFAPNDVELLFRHAAVAVKLNKFTEAINDYGMILKQRPDDSEAFYQRGIAYGAWGYAEDVKRHKDQAQTNYSAAIADYQNAAKNPAYAARAWANLWDLYRTMGDKDNAKAALAQAKQLRGSDAKTVNRPYY